MKVLYVFLSFAISISAYGQDCLICSEEDEVRGSGVVSSSHPMCADVSTEQKHKAFTQAQDSAHLAAARKCNSRSYKIKEVRNDGGCDCAGSYGCDAYWWSHYITWKVECSEET